MCRHRILSRNTASSRAIPFEKMVKDVEENPFIPIAWQKSHSGMQGIEYLTSEGHIEDAQLEWITARDWAVNCSMALNDSGVTKQLCNRLLEPFVWTTELVSGTEWENFFSLRCPKYYAEGTNNHYRSWKDLSIDFPACENYSELDRLKVNESQAEIHIQKIAEMMWDCYSESKPKTLESGQWHIPYGDQIDSIKLEELSWKQGWEYNDENATLSEIKVAVSRAARISYTTLGDNPKIDYEADIKLHDRLLESKHLSCFEHCARVMNVTEYDSFFKGKSFEHRGLEAYKPGESGWCNNYRGFIQYRYLTENENN